MKRNTNPSTEHIGGKSIVISPDDTSISLAQAIYHHVTTKTERIFEVFNESYVVSEDDIIQLSHILKQTAQRHHEDEWSCIIDHALFRKSRTRHSSVERFKSSDKSSIDPTSEVVIVYDFLCKNPFDAQLIGISPERYKITVRISQESYLSIFDKDDHRAKFIRRISQDQPITVSIEYVDYTVARAILGAVRDWVSGLNSTKRSSLSKFFLRNEFSLSSLIPLILTVCVFFGASSLAPQISLMSGDLFFSIFAIAVIFYAIGNIISENLINNIYASYHPTSINITKGDDIYFQKIESKVSRSRKLIYFLSVIILLTVIINVFSNYLYDWIMGRLA